MFVYHKSNLKNPVGTIISQLGPDTTTWLIGSGHFDLSSQNEISRLIKVTGHLITLIARLWIAQLLGFSSITGHHHGLQEYPFIAIIWSLLGLTGGRRSPIWSIGWSNMIDLAVFFTLWQTSIQLYFMLKFLEEGDWGGQLYREDGGWGLIVQGRRWLRVSCTEKTVAEG